MQIGSNPSIFLTSPHISLHYMAMNIAKSYVSFEASDLSPLSHPNSLNLPFLVELASNYRKDYGKLVVIVDVIDQNRALDDAPDMVRSQMNFKRLSLTDIKIAIKRVPKKKELIEAMKAGDVQKKWENSSWGRKLVVRKRRAALADFDRFKLMLAKTKRAGLVRQELSQLKKSAV